MSVLEVRDVTIEREGLPIVRRATLEAQAGSVTVLLGLNGAGKTTLLEGISGVIGVRAGEVLLGGERIDRRPAYRRARAGLAHVEQGRGVFPDLTTEENLLVASPSGEIEAAFTLFPELDKRRNVVGGLLSGGEQQMLVVARAIVRDPRVLLVDELSLGLAPVVLRRLMAAVVELAQQGMAIVLVEQFAALALEAGTKAYVLRGGEVVYDGTCAELRDEDGLLQRLYLGEAAGTGAAR
ncbi:ABC transporter ATP-binding protein [Conexibacter woesei]|uniref:ABC transporter ATP-binding protein n=1 Tax=Conexibacter woesei TaxID=191495 RepID=UPI000417CDEF|nr:ATP-binding cassette domain-containing protein [Conexibacter woesei]